MEDVVEQRETPLYPTALGVRNWKPLRATGVILKLQNLDCYACLPVLKGSAFCQYQAVSLRLEDRHHDDAI